MPRFASAMESPSWGEVLPADSHRCHDLTVPYPTASISLHDPFLEADLHGIHIEVDHRHIVQSWRRIQPGSNSNSASASTSTSTAHADSQTRSQLQSETAAGVPLDPRGESVDVLDDGEVRVVVSTKRKITRKRPSAPPIFMLPLPYPFSHVSGFEVACEDEQRHHLAEQSMLMIAVIVPAAPVPPTHIHPLRVSLCPLPRTHRIAIHE